jgi:hypothetical protein
MINANIIDAKQDDDVISIAEEREP